MMKKMSFLPGDVGKCTVVGNKSTFGLPQSDEENELPAWGCGKMYSDRV